MKKSNKYNASKIIVDGVSFASKKEAKRYKTLSELLNNGDISDLQMQVPYELIPAIKEPDTIGKKGGKRPGKTIQRSVTYLADFVYKDKDGNTIVEDVKGCKFGGAYAIFKIKKKLMLWRFGITVIEV